MGPELLVHQAHMLFACKSLSRGRDLFTADVQVVRENGGCPGFFAVAATVMDTTRGDVVALASVELLKTQYAPVAQMD